jgi:phosphoglucosamine mutase
MKRKYFGTDGVRGRVGKAPITPDFVMKLGYAAGKVLAARHASAEHPTVLIGKDTRVSGYMLESALQAGLSAAGVDVVLVGPMPTPAVAYLTRALRLSAGIVISASHNPYDDNGIKFFSGDGAKLPDETELEIEKLLDEPLACEQSSRLGKARRMEDAQGRYIEFCKSTFPTKLDLKGKRIVVDTAHGAAYQIAPCVFHELGADIIPIGASPDGFNINEGVGATQPQALQAEVIRTQADLGIALDGDADRVVFVDEHGQQLHGDAVIALCATRMLRRGKLKKRTLVATVMSSIGLEHAMAREGGKLLRVGVGDRYVVEAMRQKQLNFGGEQSGHLVFLDHATTGDGLLAALHMLAIVLREQRPLSELAAEVIESVPQVLLNLTLRAKKPLDEMPVTSAAIGAAERKLNGDGRVLVRWSGTEPKLRILVEGPDQKQIDTLAKEIGRAAEKELA